MLTHIHIRNFAVIDEVDLELGTGLTVLTGETGAGKSIVVDALGLALGDRADATIIRHGAAKAEITVGFEIQENEAVARWLGDQEMGAADGECLIRRVIAREGRSRAFVNGHNLPLQNLRELGSLLIDIHGQQTHHSLVRKPVQRQILDFHGGHGEHLEKVGAAFNRWRELHDEYKGLLKDHRDRESRMDLLRYQVKELQSLDLAAGEFEDLEREQRRLSAAGRLIEKGHTALGLIADNDMTSSQHQLNQAAALLGGLPEIDQGLREPAEMLASAEIQISEAAAALRQYLSRLEIDPQRTDWVEERLAAIQELARKHRVEKSDLHGLLETLNQQLANLESVESRLGELAAELSEAEERYLDAAGHLHAERVDAGGKLAQQITAMMQQLGMPGGRFDVSIASMGDDTRSADGMDRIEFVVSANPGQPPMPLSRVASGGELSRIDLSIQVVAADGTHIPSMVFDEVDQGIGGGIAEIVGRKLRSLGAHRQVICVTHLPQVASQSHHHLRVTKLTDGTTTRTTIAHLNANEKIEELARMLGGIEITDKTREHAEEMIKRAQAS